MVATNAELVPQGPGPRTAATRTLVVMVPGMSGTEPGLYLGKLIEGLKAYVDTRSIELAIEDPPKPTDPQRFRVGGGRLEIDIVETPWSDLRPRLSSESGFKKLLGGLGLLFFWLRSPKVWARALDNKYMLSGAIGALGLILAWYYGTIAAVLSVVGKDPPEFLRTVGWAEVFADLGSAMGGWPVWLGFGAVSAALPTLTVVDLSHGAMAYLENRDHFATKVKARVERVLYAALQQPEYDRVVIVAHSFGVAVAVDAIAGVARKSKPLSLMTLGGSLPLLCAAAPRLAQSQQSAFTVVDEWKDFWSKHDWLGSPAIHSAGEAPKGFESRHVDASISLTDKASGASHSLYFEDPGVYQELLDQCGWGDAQSVRPAA